MWRVLRQIMDLISFLPKRLGFVFLLICCCPLWAQHTIDTYRLAGIQLSTDSANSIAFIESKAGITSAYKMKDVIGHCQLTEIAQGYANVLCDNTTITLVLEADPITLPIGVASSSVSTQYKQLERSVFSDAYQDQQRFVNDLDMEMVVQENQMQGVKLYHRHETSVLRSTGLQDGDIVREVNGYTVMQMDKVIEQFSLLKKQQFDQINLLITRGNVPMMLVLQFN